MKQINLYSDAFSLKNPGPGAWGTILDYKGSLKELSGANPMTTSNQMHLTGIIEGLKALKQPCNVHISSTSEYVIEAVKEYLTKWIKNSWKTNDKKSIQHIELWKEYIKASKKHTIKAEYIKNHTSNKHNERCDILARAQIEKLK